jgi:hypothetical protein
MKHDFLRLGGRVASVAAAAAVCGLLSVGTTGPAGATAPPSLTITAGPYHANQHISVSVGPNKYFTPYSRINIIECADPGGSPKHLPVNVNSCDGNTIQGTTILVQRDGSFSERAYQLYALPNRSQLGETPDTRPLCNTKHSCVLYIGQNQEKFSAPKMFSAPFTLSGSGHS